MSEMTLRVHVGGHDYAARVDTDTMTATISNPVSATVYGRAKWNGCILVPIGKLAVSVDVLDALDHRLLPIMARVATTKSGGAA